MSLITSLQLSNSEQICLINSEDYEKVKQFTWHLDSEGYVARSYRKYGRTRREFLHNFILGNKFVDHKDRNPLNNSRENLRVATYSQQNSNKEKQFGNWTSKYKGVSWAKKNSKWIAVIYVNNKRIYLGQYEIETEAAKAYNKAAELYHKQFAVLNVL